VLDIVERQIDDIHRDLDVQMRRIAQIQQQMDELRAAVRRMLPSTERNRRRHDDRRKVSFGNPSGLEGRRRSERRTGRSRRSD
jgi:ribosomal protein L13